MYPIGSVYMTSNNVNYPEIHTKYGFGVWEKINGKYLLASGELCSGEVFSAGQYVTAGLPWH